MEAEITLKNYRSFEEPARLSLREGFTSFIGINNSGKSSLLRFFYEFRNLFEQFREPQQLVNSLTNPRRFNLSVPDRDASTVFCDFNERPLEIDLRLSLGRESLEKAQAGVVDRLTLSVPRTIIEPHNDPSARAVSGAAYVGQNQLLNIDRLRLKGALLYEGDVLKLDLTSITNWFGLLAQALYIGSFRNALNIGIESQPTDQWSFTDFRHPNYFDINVGRDFIQKWADFKLGAAETTRRAIAVEEAVQDMFGFKSLQINAATDNTTLSLIINRNPRKLYEVGSGLTQFILALAHAAMKQPSFILIDEPELSLHPSLQMKFLNKLNSFARYGTLFATHSIGLARAAASSRIYSVQQDDHGRSAVHELDDTPNLSDFLSELSFHGYRELGFDKILLAEGRTDCSALRPLLRTYGKDHKIVVLSLGGSDQITARAEPQLQEIKRICPNVTALIDSEKDSEKAKLHKDREGFVTACERVGIPCHVLSRRALENYFSDRAVGKVHGKKYRAPDHYERLEKLKLRWNKNESWRISQEMTREELDLSDLGQFLAKL